ncbi:uncharacterized protein LOC121599302 [Anopheles merus]|uniref:DUF4806 domain-containing protein n=1 Tax=Anopheles merus TaxID=30066 RepID=A0A9I3MIJ5_ANOME|nr:uncharacterized protein LOC121599302 [Anopheles merus]XP_041782947.1 uncharacterized protein LOC121599302 [Anopheles merus]
MPYAIIETDDAAGKKKLLVVPEAWVEDEQGEYLRWPDAKSMKRLKELLEDEKSSPTPVWEKRNCKIICQQVPSLVAGEKTIEIIHNSSDAGTSDQTTGTNKNLIDTIAKATSTSSMKGGKCKTAIAQNSKTVAYDPPSVGSTLIVVEESQPSENLQDLLSVVIPKEENEDSFDDSDASEQLLEPSTNDPLEQECLSDMTETEKRKNEQNLLSLLGIEEPEYDPFDDVSSSSEASQPSVSSVAGKNSANIDPLSKPLLNVIDAKQLRDLQIIEYNPFEVVSPSPEVSQPSLSNVAGKISAKIDAPRNPRLNVIHSKQLRDLETIDYDLVDQVGPSRGVSQPSVSNVYGKISAKNDPPRIARVNVIDAKQLRGLDTIVYDLVDEVSPSLGVSQPSVSNMPEKSSAKNDPPTPRVNVIDAKQLRDDAQRFFSGTSKEADSEPSVEIQTFSQLIDMVHELKCTIERNQKDIKKIIWTAMSQVNRSIHKLLDKEMNESCENLSDDDEDQAFDLLTTVEEVENFEERLKDETYQNKIHRWVDYCVRFESSALFRMHKMLDLIFDRKLLAKFSWSGRNKQFPMKHYENILKLFEYIGTNSMEHVKREDVTAFFLNKLKHAQYRVNLRSYTMSVPRKRKHPNKRSDQGQASKSKKGPAEEISNTPELNVSNESTSKISAVGIEPSIPNLEKRPVSIAPAGTSYAFVKEILPEINIAPAQSLAQMDEFETALNDEKRKKQAQSWVDRTVGQIADAEQRMKVLLERLIDRNVLLNFCWTDTSSGKRRLDQYKNFVRLFEYASRTMLFNTVVFNHGFVASFFAKTLDHVAQQVG